MNFQIFPLTVKINCQINGFGYMVEIVETFGDAVENVKTSGERVELTRSLQLSLQSLNV